MTGTSSVGSEQAVASITPGKSMEELGCFDLFLSLIFDDCTAQPEDDDRSYASSTTNVTDATEESLTFRNRSDHERYLAWRRMRAMRLEQSSSADDDVYTDDGASQAIGYRDAGGTRKAGDKYSNSKDNNFVTSNETQSMNTADVDAQVPAYCMSPGRNQQAGDKKITPRGILVCGKRVAQTDMDAKIDPPTKQPDTNKNNKVAPSPVAAHDDVSVLSSPTHRDDWSKSAGSRTKKTWSQRIAGRVAASSSGSKGSIKIGRKAQQDAGQSGNVTDNGSRSIANDIEEPKSESTGRRKKTRILSTMKHKMRVSIDLPPTPKNKIGHGPIATRRHPPAADVLTIGRGYSYDGVVGAPMSGASVAKMAYNLGRVDHPNSGMKARQAGPSLAKIDAKPPLSPTSPRGFANNTTPHRDSPVPSILIPAPMPAVNGADARSQASADNHSSCASKNMHMDIASTIATNPSQITEADFITSDEVMCADGQGNIVTIDDDDDINSGSSGVPVAGTSGSLATDVASIQASTVAETKSLYDDEHVKVSPSELNSVASNHREENSTENAGSNPASVASSHSIHDERSQKSAKKGTAQVSDVDTVSSRRSSTSSKKSAKSLTSKRSQAASESGSRYSSRSKQKGSSSHSQRSQSSAKSKRPPLPDRPGAVSPIDVDNTNLDRDSIAMSTRDDVSGRGSSSSVRSARSSSSSQRRSRDADVEAREETLDDNPSQVGDAADHTSTFSGMDIVKHDNAHDEMKGIMGRGSDSSAAGGKFVHRPPLGLQQSESTKTTANETVSGSFSASQGHHSDSTHGSRGKKKPKKWLGRGGGFFMKSKE